MQLLDSKYSRTAQIHQSSEILNSLNKDLITRACACTWVTRSAILSVFVAFCQWLWWWWWWWLWWLYYITVHWTVTMMGRWPHQRQVGRIGGRSDIALQLDVTIREWALSRSICICNIICICEYICISICMQQWLDVTMKGWALSRSICICIFSICILCVFVSVFVCSSDVTLQLNDTLRGWVLSRSWSYFDNKLAKLQATLVGSYDSPTDLLTGVKCRATSIAKNGSIPLV